MQGAVEILIIVCMYLYNLFARRKLKRCPVKITDSMWIPCGRLTFDNKCDQHKAIFKEEHDRYHFFKKHADVKGVNAALEALVELEQRERYRRRHNLEHDLAHLQWMHDLVQTVERYPHQNVSLHLCDMETIKDSYWQKVEDASLEEMPRHLLEPQRILFKNSPEFRKRYMELWNNFETCLLDHEFHRQNLILQQKYDECELYMEFDCV